MFANPVFRYFYLPWGLGLFVMAWVLLDARPDYCGTEDFQPDKQHSPVVAVEAPPENVVFTNPYFPGCDGLTGKEKRTCSQHNLMDYLHRHAGYAAGNPVHKSAGLVVADFVVTPTGSIQDIQLLRAPDRERGQDVVRLLQEMEGNGIRWEPATRNGKPISQRMVVRVRYNMVWAGSK